MTSGPHMASSSAWVLGLVFGLSLASWDGYVFVCITCSEGRADSPRFRPRLSCGVQHQGCSSQSPRWEYHFYFNILLLDHEERVQSGRLLIFLGEPLRCATTTYHNRLAGPGLGVRMPRPGADQAKRLAASNAELLEQRRRAQEFRRRRLALGERHFGAAVLMLGTGQNKWSTTSMTTPTM